MPSEEKRCTESQRLILFSFLRFWDVSTMIGPVFQLWKVGHQQVYEDPVGT